LNGTRRYEEEKKYGRFSFIEVREKKKGDTRKRKTVTGGDSQKKKKRGLPTKREPNFLKKGRGPQLKRARSEKSRAQTLSPSVKKGGCFSGKKRRRTPTRWKMWTQEKKARSRSRRRNEKEARGSHQGKKKKRRNAQGRTERRAKSGSLQKKREHRTIQTGQ